MKVWHCLMVMILSTISSPSDVATMIKSSPSNNAKPSYA
jgi:hypothetical protein